MKETKNKFLSQVSPIGSGLFRLGFGGGSSPSERYEKLYTMLLDAIPSSVLFIDREMRIVSANRNFLEKNYRVASRIIGQRLEKIFPTVILEHMDLKRGVRQVFEENKPTIGKQMSYRMPGLPLRFFYYRIFPFSWNGVVENAILLMDDVTERVRLSDEVRRVERHLSSVVESASDLILSSDIDGRILTWNTAAEKISGYTFHEVKGRLFFEYCVRNSQQEVKRVFNNLKIGKGSCMAEWDIVSKHGEQIPVYWVCSPMKDEQSRTVGIVAVGRDLAERRKLEMQLLQTQKLAALGVMAGGIAHEVRNPLAICSSAAQFLMDDEIDPAFSRECAGKIHKGIQGASVIIEKLLKFARPSVQTDIERVNLSLLLKETLDLVANQAKIQKIELTIQFPKVPVFVSGEASLLQQMFMNLFLNAIKAMPDGGILGLSMERRADEVVVRVVDTGQGITPTEIGKIFDPFYTTSPVGKGTGLGLSICYSIVKQHFGSIEVESIEGKGTTFTVRLPVLVF